MRRLLITLICVTLSLFVAAPSWSVDYNDGGSHNITAVATENVNVSNGTTIVVNSATPKNDTFGYPFSGHTLTLTGGSQLISDPAAPYTGESLGKMNLVLDASSVTLTHFTSNNNITLSNGSTLSLMNAAGSSYGALLGNGQNGRISVTSGTNYVKLYEKPRIPSGKQLCARMRPILLMFPKARPSIGPARFRRIRRINRCRNMARERLSFGRVPSADSLVRSVRST